MNNQEAIDLLDNLIGMISDNQDSDYDDALKMGISALFENKCFEGMSNGEVLQALYPTMKTEDTSVESLIGTNLDRGYVVFQRDWWNAPYKAESEESE